MYNFPCIYGKKCLLGHFFPHPSKAGFRFAQPGSQQKRDNFYHVNTLRPSLPGRSYADFAKYQTGD